MPIHEHLIIERCTWLSNFTLFFDVYLIIPKVKPGGPACFKCAGETLALVHVLYIHVHVYTSDLICMSIGKTYKELFTLVA